MIGQELQHTELIPTAAEEEARSESQLFPTMLLAFGTLILVITITRLLRKATTRQRTRVAESPREVITRVRTEATASREPLSTMMAEASELSRTLAKTLDAKAARLELLIEQADERLQTLRELVASVQPNGTGPSASGQLDRQVANMADEGCDAIQIARKLHCSIGEVELILALRQSTYRSGG